MANWLLPALRAILPQAGDIGSAGRHQIAELQAAASQQSAHIKELAAQLESTVTALEKAAELAEARLRRVLLFTALAVAFSVAALAVTFVGALVR